MNENVDIFICAHKPLLYEPKDTTFKVICGKDDDVTTEKIDIIREDGYLSNLGFCELSRFYYIWKNVELKAYVGINHYRRFFDFNGNSAIEPLPDIEKIFENGTDVILPDPWNIGNIALNYKVCHNINDLGICVGIIKDKFPEYIETTEKVLNNGFFLQGNMFVMRKEDFNEYCEFMFGVLLDYCKIAGIDYCSDASFTAHVQNNLGQYIKYGNGIGSKVSYQSRICSFLSERLTTIFMLKKFDPSKWKTFKQIDRFEGDNGNDWK